jgi:hypothetical protein
VDQQKISRVDDTPFEKELFSVPENTDSIEMTFDSFLKGDVFEKIGAEEPSMKRRRTDDLFSEGLTGDENKYYFESPNDDNDASKYLFLNRDSNSHSNGYLFLAVVFGLMCISQIGGSQT